MKPHLTRTVDEPGESITDHAAAAAFDAIDGFLTEAGLDPQQCWAVVMVLVPDGHPQNATVAGHMPGEPSTEALVEHCLTQLQVIANEIGVTITATRNQMN